MEIVKTIIPVFLNAISIRGMIILIILMLPNILFAVLPVKGVPHKTEDAGAFLNFLEQSMRIAYFAVLIFGTNNNKINSQKLVMIGMIVCIVIYYLLWLRYFINGRENILLFKKILGIPVPMAVFPVLFLILAGFWLNSIWLIVIGILFGIGHVLNSYCIYCQLSQC